MPLVSLGILQTLFAEGKEENNLAAALQTVLAAGPRAHVDLILMNHTSQTAELKNRFAL